MLHVIACVRFPQQRNAAATLTAATIIVSSLFSILSSNAARSLAVPACCSRLMSRRSWEANSIGWCKRWVTTS